MSKHYCKLRNPLLKRVDNVNVDLIPMSTNIVLLSTKECAVPCTLNVGLSSMKLGQDDNDDDVSFEAQTITIDSNRYILHD